VDNIDLEAADRLGVKVFRAVGANARGVAELTIGLLLALARAIPFSDARLKAGRWERRKGFEVEGKTLGLVGCGQVGRRVASMAVGLGMKVLAHDPVEDASFRPGPAFSYAPLAEAMSRSDVVSLHCPPPEDGRPMIDGETLARMKDGACLINTARAALLDEDAVLAALESGHLGGLAMDVFGEEPPTDSALVGHERVIATPHVGGYTVESVDRAVNMAVQQMLDYLSSCED
jgi:phosphoglycerate dehydrogenase-like enzyme